MSILIMVLDINIIGRIWGKSKRECSVLIFKGLLLNAGIRSKNWGEALICQDLAKSLLKKPFFLLSVSVVCAGGFFVAWF